MNIPTTAPKSTLTIVVKTASGEVVAQETHTAG
jgi:hypothetical protein